MLISDSHEFIFVHNYKVAGSSIKHALKPYAQTAFERLGWVQRQCARLRLREIPTYPAHLTAREIRSDHPDEWRRYFTFGFVRNPWAWQVSLYFFMLETEDHHQHDLISSMDGFDEYIHWRVNEDKHLQSEFFCDPEGSVLVDSIGRLESIQDDFQAICERVGVDASLPHKNSSSHRGYRMYYTDDTRQLVQEHFEEDIERFGYTFDGVEESSSGAESMR